MSPTTTTSFGRSKTGDRFYNPPARRQQQQLLFQKQQIQSHDRDEVKSAVAAVAEAPGSSVSDSLTNLDKFLMSTTPLLPAQYFPKTTMKGWRSQEDKPRPYFVLEDLWEFFDEWSAYGAGVPLVLDGGETVIQYYCPSLSGIQLYIDPSKPSPGTRRPGEESDESYRETSSDGSSDCETERGMNSLGMWRQQELAETNLHGMKGLSLRVQPLNSSSSDEGESSSSSDVLMFEYFERTSPFARQPLADKISFLASRFPELNTCRSYELSPSSWISVAWYPIYRIPTGPTLKNLESCFLTFHSLSTPTSEVQNEWPSHFGSSPSCLPNGRDMAIRLPLPVFGLAHYKFQISMWDPNGADKSSKINSLVQAADEWLRHLNVTHPDYCFFASRNAKKY